MAGTQRLSSRMSFWAAPALVLGLVLAGCGGGDEQAASTSESASASASATSASAQPTNTAQPTQTDPPADCALLEEAMGAYYPAAGALGSAITANDPGGVFTAARQLDDVLNGFANGAPGMSAAARVFIGLNEEVVRMAIEASETGDVTGLDVRIQELIRNDEARYEAGLRELDEYVNAQCS